MAAIQKCYSGWLAISGSTGQDCGVLAVKSQDCHGCRNGVRKASLVGMREWRIRR